MKKIALLLILFVSTLFLLSFKAEKLSSQLIITQMSSSIKQIKSLRFKLRKKERINDKLKYGEQDVKFNRLPQKKIYTKIHAPNEGVELIWIEGVNNGKAYVNPNAFPYINLNLDPYGSIMRKGNHHTVYEVGFDYINSIITNIADKSSDEFDKVFIYKGETVFDNRSCYKMLIDYTPYKYINYTVKDGETVTDIAYRFYVSDYMILQLNKDVKDYNDVDAGQIITIPTAYAPKTLLYIDKETNLPLVQMMYDEKGLYAQYEFYNLQLNSEIASEEFTSDYKDYHF